MQKGVVFLQDLKRIFTHLGPFKKEFVLCILLIIAETAFELSIPLIMADIIDVGVQNRDIHLIFQKGVQMGVCALLSLITGLLYARYAAQAALGFGAYVREAEFRKIQDYSFANLDHFEVSSLITRMTTDITVMQNAITNGIRPMIRGPVALVIGLFLAFWMNAALALVFVVCIPILACVLFFIVKKVAPLYTKLQLCMDRVNAVIQENLTAIRAVKAFVREDYEERYFDEANRALAGAERIFDLMEEKPETDEGHVVLTQVFQKPDKTLEKSTEHTGMWAWEDTRSHRLTPLKGDVRFHDVVFGYEEDKVILDRISLYAKPGQKIAFVGSTGAGKTTIINLINRFYDISGGSITYDGIDVREIKKESLRRSLGIVLQDTHLFTGTIADNIRFGKLDATDEEVRQAAVLANADSFIRRMPEGYDTWITGDGQGLSQGQRQLLAIARAAIADPPVLILDEATSSIDTRTERLIEKGMDHLMEGRTVFVIAHRLSTVRNSNAIMVLDHGHIIERGDHEELLAQKGVYYQLYHGMTELS